MSDHDDIGTRLAHGLHEEAERVRPEPALQSILTRTRQAPASRGWWPVAGAALVAGGLVAAGFAFVALDNDATVFEPPIASTPQVEVTLYFTNPDGKLVSEQVSAPDTGDPGVDAVNALLTGSAQDPDYSNQWSSVSGTSSGSGMQLKAPVTVSSVTQAAGDITVDFSGPVDSPWEGDPAWAFDPAVFSQQLVWTVKDALGGEGLVVVTMDGEPVRSLLTGRVGNPMQRDPYALSPVQIESPAQGEPVSSPVTVSGQSATFEANVAWRIRQDGKVVKDGFTTSEGANGVFGPFAFEVGLRPGDYTVEAFENSPENGRIINLDSKEFTVE